MNRDALVVGINRYPSLKDSPTEEVDKNLITPARDAEAIAHLLETKGKFRVKRFPQTAIQNNLTERSLQIDPDQLVTTKELKEAIAQLFNPSTHHPPDVALLYFSGHGLRRTDSGNVTEGYLASSEASCRKGEWGVSLKWLRELLKISPVQQQIVWLDCCNSGELFNFAPEDLQITDSGKVRFFISASRDFENAYSNLKLEHGALTELLLRYLEPNQVINDGIINSVILTKLIEGQLKLPQSPIIHCDKHQPINLTAIPERQHLLNSKNIENEQTKNVEEKIINNQDTYSESMKNNSIKISNTTYTGDILQDNVVEGGIKNTHSSESSHDIKEKTMNSQDVITYFESENGFDFINANYQKSSDNYGKIFNVVYSKFKLVSMQDCLTELQQEPSNVNKLFFLKILKAQILADEKFAEKLIDIIKQLQSDGRNSSDRPAVEKIEQKINYGNAQFHGNFTGGNQNVTR